jgi:predicted nucleic acid-binding protein
VIFDTDVLVGVQRGNAKATKLVDEEAERFISSYTYMELLQGAQNKKQQTESAVYLKGMGFKILPISENISHRAAVYVEEYALSHGLRAGDALIAATAAEHGEILCTGNAKHFGRIQELRLKVLKT